MRRARQRGTRTARQNPLLHAVGRADLAGPTLQNSPFPWPLPLLAPLSSLSYRFSYSGLCCPLAPRARCEPPNTRLL